jgi:hypothetical protein
MRQIPDHELLSRHMEGRDRQELFRLARTVVTCGCLFFTRTSVMDRFSWYLSASSFLKAIDLFRWKISVFDGPIRLRARIDLAKVGRNFV